MLSSLAEADARQSRRRRRPATSCILCRKRKIRCDRNVPCSNCVRAKKPDCVYSPRPEPMQHQRGQRLLPLPSCVDSNISAEHQSTCSISTSRTPSQTLTVPSSQAADLLSPITSCCAQSEQQNVEYSKTANGAVSDGIPGTKVAKTGVLVDDLHTTNCGVMSKTRLFGPTHWMNGAMLLQPLFDSFEQLAQDNSSQALSILSECKTLARTIKHHRNKHSAVPLGIPTREIADKLVDGYMRDFESIFRVLHIPSFTKDYERFWSTADQTLQPVFQLQLKLVLAIGSSTFDKDFSMRKNAMQWVNEAAVWLSTPVTKSRLTVPALQVMILLCLAQETTGVGADLVWIPTGSLLRTAITMGLHRDPKKLPRMSLINAEMRRRLWNTILEISIQSSIDSGCPPLISLSDFDTEPPHNFDDSELSKKEGESFEPRAQSAEHYTQTSTSIALRETFPVRLAIAKLHNDLRPGRPSYQDLLRMDTELRAAYRQLSKTLQSVKRGSPTTYEARFLNFIIQRYFLSLHVPWYDLGLHDAAFAYSRRVVIETASKIWHATSGEDDLARLSICGAGFFRSAPVMASLAIAVELRTHLLEEESLGPKAPRPDLLAILYDAKDWSLKRIEAGETNIKGHLSIAALCAQIDAMAQGLYDKEIHQAFVSGTEEALHRCLTILQGASHAANMASCEIGAHEEVGEPDAQFDVAVADNFFSFSPNWLFDDTSPNTSLW